MIATAATAATAATVAIAASHPQQHSLKVVEKRLEDVLCALCGNAWKEQEILRTQSRSGGGGGGGAEGKVVELGEWWCEGDGEEYSVVLVWKEEQRF